MIYYINYADKRYLKQQKMALRFAKFFGGFDKVIAYSPSDIDKMFYEENKNILSQERGGGYWLWKPYFIGKALRNINDDDYLFYSDSGSIFLKNVDLLVAEMNRHSQDVMGFELPLIEEQWTKKELFMNMKCDVEEIRKSNHMSASFILMKKSKESIKFIREFLDYSCNEMNITDAKEGNTVQGENFIEHRHDQSIFSLLYKKYNYRPFKDPSQFGKFPMGYSGAVGERISQYIPSKLYFFENGRMFRYFEYQEKYGTVLFHNRCEYVFLGLLKFCIKVLLVKTGILSHF